MSDVAHPEMFRLSGKWKVLLAISAILAALTYVEKNATALFEGFPQLRSAVYKSIYGPELVKHQLPNVSGGISDGGTSDGTKAYKKTSDICLRPLHDNGTLVPGSAQFVATRRSSTDRATVTVTRDDAHAYCVTLMAATGAKEKLEIIEGYLSGQEQYPATDADKK
jgi:hypothetical protein